MPELLSEKGYATGMFGKWHLGDTKGRFPTDQGFDEWYDIANTTDESQYTWQFQYDADVGLKPFIQEAKRGEEPKTVEPYDLSVRRKIDTELTDATHHRISATSNKGRETFLRICPAHTSALTDHPPH